MASTAPFDIGTLIEATPGVYGGRPCLAGSSFPILQLAADYNSGYAPSDFLDHYPHLDAAHVYAGIAYYLANKAAIDEELARNLEEGLEAMAASRRSRSKASA